MHFEIARRIDAPSEANFSCGAFSISSSIGCFLLSHSLSIYTSHKLFNKRCVFLDYLTTTYNMAAIPIWTNFLILRRIKKIVYSPSDLIWLILDFNLYFFTDTEFFFRFYFLQYLQESDLN